MQIFKIIRTLTMAGAFAFTISLPASAVTLDFSAVQGNQGASLALPEVTISNLSGGIVLVGPGAAGPVDGFCFLLGSFCDSSGEMVFTNAVENLSFDIDGAGNGDNVEISAFNGLTLLGSIVATTNGNLDFSGFGALTRLFFDDSSTAFGVGFSTFNFDVANVSPVPLPASLPLFGSALAFFGYLGWRRKRKTVS